MDVSWQTSDLTRVTDRYNYFQDKVYIRIRVCSFVFMSLLYKNNYKQSRMNRIETARTLITPNNTPTLLIVLDAPYFCRFAWLLVIVV